MSDTETLQTETHRAPAVPQAQPPIVKAISTLREARSNRAIDHLLQQLANLAQADRPTMAAVQHRRQEVRQLLVKTRKVAWIWANVYGYGDDELFPDPLYDREAAYLAVVQAGVILVLDSGRRRVACFISQDGCAWKRYSIRRNAPLNNPSIYVCRIRRFPKTDV